MAKRTQNDCYCCTANYSLIWEFEAVKVLVWAAYEIAIPGDSLKTCHAWIVDTLPPPLWDMRRRRFLRLDTYL